MAGTAGLNIAKLKQNVLEYWNAEKWNWPVKVISAARGAAIGAAPGRITNVRGYVTSEKYVRGRTPAEAEKILGLKPGELAGGAVILKLNRLPLASEFELRAYTYLPGGQPYTGGAYPPGLGANQWEITTDIPATVLNVCGPGQRL